MKLEKLLNSRLMDYLMLICIMGYALLKLAHRWTGDIFLGILLLGTLFAMWQYRKYFFRDKIFWLLIASILIPIICWINAKLFTPYDIGKLDIGELASLFYFLCIAYWLKGRPYYVLLTLLFFSLGVILTYIMNTPEPLAEFLKGFKGQRIGASITNSNHLATLAGGGLLISSLFIFLVFKYYYKLRSWYSFLCLMFCLALIAIFVLLIYLTQSRATWLALTCTAIVTIIFSFFVQSKSKLKLTVIYGLLFFTFLFLIFQNQQIKSRVFAEKSQYKQLLTKPINEVPYSSIGLRVKLWASATPWIKQYPILGLGDYWARKFVIEQSPYLSNNYRKEFAHLHQGHLEILVGFGLLGLLSVWSIYFYLLRTAFLVSFPYKHYVIWGSLIFACYYFIINCFESFFIFKTGEQIHNVFLGCVYTFYLTKEMGDLGFQSKFPKK